MQTTTLKLYILSYSEMKTYLMAMIFAAGNILLPQLVHFVPQGGFIFLPIYFFTLIAAYKYGWKVGLLTAILSPVINHLLFGMPPLPVLPAILTKSVCLALMAGFTAQYFKKISVPILIMVVLGYQIIGTSVEFFMVDSFREAIQDFRLGIPGMLIQIFGGYLVIRYLLRK